MKSNQTAKIITLLYLLALAAGAAYFAGSGLWRDMLLLPGGGLAVQPAVRYG